MTSFADHEALRGLNTEQLAELALYGLRYRALGAAGVDFSKPDVLAPYWTGERLVKKSVEDATAKPGQRTSASILLVGEARGHLSGLFNCGVITNDFYMEQYRILNASLR